MKRITFLMFLTLLYSWSSFAQVPVGIQDGNTTIIPISGNYGYTYSQQLAYQPEINAQGDITSLSFYFSSGNNTAGSTGWTIYLGHTSKTEFGSNTDWIPSSALTQVYTGTVTYPAPDNQMQITFDTPFTYNNTDNLVVAIHETEPSYGTSLRFGKTADIGTNRTIYARHDRNNPDPTSPPSGTRLNYINSMILGGIMQSCPAPIDLVVVNTTPASADISWTEYGPATEWEVLYGEAGFDPETAGQTVTVNVNSATTLTGLNQGTAYEFYVKSICSTTEESSLFGPAFFATSCQAVPIPFAEGFENGYIHNQKLDGCWSQASILGDQTWTVNTSLTDYNRTPRTGDWNVYLRYGNTDWMYYALELTANTQYELEFYARQNSASGVTIEAAYGISNDPASMTETIVSEEAVVDGDYQKFSGFFTPAASGTYYIGIKGALTGAPYYLSVDDIRVDLAPNCLMPIELMANDIVADSAHLSWTDGEAEDQWEVLYGLVGFDTATEGTAVQVNGDAETTITGLDANTAYEFYVKAICDVNDESELAGPLAFSTLCSAGSVPFMEGFEAHSGGDSLSGCWTQTSVVGVQEWVVNDSNTTFNRTPRTGDKNVTLRWGNEDWMFHSFELTANTTYHLEFYARQDKETGANVEAAYGAFGDPASMIDEIIADTEVTNGNYQLFSGDFTPTASGVYYVGIKGTTNSTPFQLSIDDISLTEAPICTAPSDLLVSNITVDSGDLSWTAGDIETEWEVLYGEANFDPATEGTSIEVNTVPETTLTGLDENTQYEFYVRAVCDVNDKSSLIGPVAFTTLMTGCDSTTVPYALDFEDVTTPALPECTTVQNVGSGNNWETATASANGFNSTVLRYKWNTANSGNTWFYTQGLELEEGVEYQITYKYGNNSGSTFNESMKVAFGDSPEASSMTNELADYPSVSGGVATLEVLTFSVNANGVYYFGFNAYSAINQFHLYLDDILIKVAGEDCDPATDVAISEITENSANVSWTASTTATDGYDVEVYLEGEDPATATAQVSEPVAAGVTTATITGLLADTAYDVYVIADCGDDTAISDVVNFTTTELGVNSNDLTKISYFPNPVKDQLTINAAGKLDMVTVTNLLGQTVMQVEPKSTNVVLDMSVLPVGTYILKANVDSAISTFKVIKE